jgi:hypothetical protein
MLGEVHMENVGQAVMGYLDTHTEPPKPFIWTATADAILERLAKLRNHRFRRLHRFFDGGIGAGRPRGQIPYASLKSGLSAGQSGARIAMKVDCDVPSAQSA